MYARNNKVKFIFVEVESARSYHQFVYTKHAFLTKPSACNSTLNRVIDQFHDTQNCILIICFCVRLIAQFLTVVFPVEANTQFYHKITKISADTLYIDKIPAFR